MQYCDGSDWIEMGHSANSGTSNCSNPTRAPGTMVYNADYSVMQYCNGVDWVSMGTVPFPLGDLGKIAHWKLNESTGTVVYDSLGSYDGTLINGAIWDASGGAQGGAVVLDGTDDYVSIPYHSNLNPAQFTVMMWVKPDVLEDSSLFRGAAGTGWTPNGGYRILELGTTGVLRTYCNNGSTNYSAIKGYIYANEWNLVVTSYDGTNLKLYINGFEDPGVAAATCLQLLDTDILFGNSSGFEEFDGKIDDVMLFDNALSEDVLNNVYVASGTVPSPPTSGLVGYWKLDESSGTTAVDSSGNGFDGTVENASTWDDNGGVVKGTLLFNSSASTDVKVPYNATLYPTSGVTYSLWVYPLSHGAYDYERIVSRRRNLYDLRFIANGHAVFNLTVNGTTASVDSGEVISLNEWHHLVGTYDGSEVAIYVDGNKKGSVAASGSISGPGADLYIGAESTNGDSVESFDGYIDEVRMYNRGLSTAEIRQLRLYREYKPSTTCTNPAGSAGDMIFNTNHSVMQYCNGWTWVGIGK